LMNVLLTKKGKILAKSEFSTSYEIKILKR